MLSPQDSIKVQDLLTQLEERLGLTIGLGTLVPEKACGVVLGAVDGRTGFSFHLEVGFEFPLYTAAPGKAMLAFLPEDERAHYIDQLEFRRLTPTTITSGAEFERELESVRQKGYGVDLSEELEGCHCVGVPVFLGGHDVVGGLWATAPSSRLPLRQFDDVAQILRKASVDITRRLSTDHRSPNREAIRSVVAQAREIMDTRTSEPIDVESLAANLYVGYSWFRRVFKEEVGVSPAAYHLERRLQNATMLLAETPLSIREISEASGFKNQNHFSALFKRKYGLSPSGWRTQYAKVH